MKLSDVKGERVLDVIADIIEPISNIAGDDELLSALKDAQGSSKDKVKSSLVKIAPVAIRAHKKDVISILATIKGVTVREYEDGMNLANITLDLLDILNDEEFVSFFISSSKTEETSTDG